MEKPEITNRNIALHLLELAIHLVIITVLVLATVQPVGPQAMGKEATMPAAVSEAARMEKQATDAASKKPEYQLPYPGLLPDHPLYVLKTIRDRIIDILIADSLKKAEFTLLESEKRVAAAASLVEKGRVELAESTASKGGNYRQRSIESYKKAKAEGKDVGGFTNKLTASLGKQEEVLRALVGKTSGDIQERFKKLVENVNKQEQALQSSK